MKKLFVLSLLSFLSLFIFACGDDEKKNDPLEIIGTYTDDFGGTHLISETSWDQGSMGKFNITEFNNIDDYLIAQNAETNAFNPDKWSRMDWMWSDSDLYFCQTAYDKNSAVEAEAVTPANAEDVNTGCNGFGWSKLISSEK